MSEALGEQFSEDVELAPLEELEALLDQIPAATERAHYGGALEDACRIVDQKNRLVDRAVAVAARLPVLKRHVDDRDELRHRAKQMRIIGSKIVDADSSEDYRGVRFDVQALEEHIQSIERALTRGMGNLLRNEFSPTVALGRVLSQVEEEQIKALGDEMIALGREAEALRNVESAQFNDAVRELRDRRQSLRGALGDLGADEDVVSFLQDIANGSVPLSRIAGTVLPWLQQHGAVDALIVKLEPHSAFQH